VDALEVMAVPSLPFLVTTRIIAGLIAIVPLYVVGLLSSYFASRLVVTAFFGQSTGTYDDTFDKFLPPGDVLWSFGKVLVFAIMVILIHCYHGYTASGGPAGVGVAVGHAVRTSIVAINVVDLLLSMAIWGTTTTVRLAG
jgi:phospholipid/cholesterol/gamma-HCH transport system permease protein